MSPKGDIFPGTFKHSIMLLKTFFLLAYQGQELSEQVKCLSSYQEQ